MSKIMKAIGIGYIDYKNSKECTNEKQVQEKYVKKMSKKVLGFYEKDAEVKLKKTMTTSSNCDYLVDGFKLVSVFEVEWLEDYCKNIPSNLGEYEIGYQFALEDLLFAIHKKTENSCKHKQARKNMKAKAVE